MEMLIRRLIGGTIFCNSMNEFDPYYKWLGIPLEQQPPNHYRLLGVEKFEPDVEVIESAADRQMSYVQQCASGNYSDVSQQLLNELAAARVCLLNSQQKLEYDTELRNSFEIETEPIPPIVVPPKSRRSKRRKASDLQRLLPIITAIAGVFLGGMIVVVWRAAVNDDDSQMPGPNGSVVNGDQRPNGIKYGDSSVAPKDAIHSQLFKNTIGMKFALVPSGEFNMGSAPGERSADDDERPVHRVRISQPFYMSIYEVTRREYGLVVTNDSTTGDDVNDPVTDVSWFQAENFCKKLQDRDGNTYRLPTEAEWEYACRAGSSTSWSFSDRSGSMSKYAWCVQNSNGRVHSVGSLLPNRFGLFDMHGNVGEWCQDWYLSGYYRRVVAGVDPQGPTSSSETTLSTKIVRGGNWSNTAERCRSGFRGGNSPTIVSSRIGFRLVLVIDAARD